MSCQTGNVFGETHQGVEKNPYGKFDRNFPLVTEEMG